MHKILRNLVRKVPSSVKAEIFTEGKLTAYMDYVPHVVKICTEKWCLVE
jgi:hypothetical protein